MIHADPINVDVGVGVQPYIPRVVSEVDVAGPSTQSQRERPVFIDIDDYDDVVVPEQPHEHMSQQPNDQMGQQPHEQMGQQIHTPRRKFFASKNVDFKKRATVNDNTTTGPASKKKTSSGEEGFDEEELDVLPESTNMDYPDIDDLPIKDDYHSSQSLSSESEPDEESDCDTNLEEEEETAEPYRYREYRKVADKYDDMYADKESEDHVPWTCETYELEIGMTWPTMKEYKTFVTRFCVANTMEITKTKDDKDRLRCRCKDPKCSFRLNGNLQKDGSTIKVTKYVPKHTCVNRDMSKKKKLDNSTWIASVIKQDVPTHTWAWSTFDLTSKCEHVTNNFTEAFNSWMLDVRCQPLHKLLEGFNLKVMGLIFERKMKFLQWEREGKILVPRAGRIMNNKISKKNRYKLFEQIEFEWCVQSRMSGSRWDVRLTEKSCSCCVWDITGIPCVHAVAVGIHLRDDMNSMVDDLQKVSSYIKAYAGKHEMRPNKPKYKRKVGRPQLNRIRSDVEGRPNPEKDKRSYGGCSSSAHNVRRFPTNNVPSTSATGRGRGRGRSQGRGRGDTEPAGRSSGAGSSQGTGRGTPHAQLNGRGVARGRGAAAARPVPPPYTGICGAGIEATTTNFHSENGFRADGMREAFRPPSQTFKPAWRR